MTVVVDAAALMALMLGEPGAEAVATVVRGSLISAVNVSECCSRGVERGATAEDVLALIRAYEVRVVAFDLPHAIEAARLRPSTRKAGAGIGDRACLALASLNNARVYTADTRLATLHETELDIRMIR